MRCSGIFLLLINSFVILLVDAGVFFENPLTVSRRSLPVILNKTKQALDFIVKYKGAENCLQKCSNDKDCATNNDCKLCDPEEKICTSGCGISCQNDSDCAGTAWCHRCKGVSGCPTSICPLQCKRSMERSSNCAAKCYRNHDCRGGRCYLCGGGTCAID